jgi:hypothetical protein
MKRIFFYVFALLFSLCTFSQKSKTPAKKSNSVSTTKGLFAKVDNLVVENKNGNFQITIDSKDAIIVKSVDAKFAPSNVKISSFTAAGSKLYLLQWTEITQNKSDLKTEDITTNYSNVYDIPSKKQVFNNTELTNHIVEKVFLDRLKTASETQERMRREGFAFTLNADGSITQKNKTQENKWVFDATKMEFVDAKKKK